MKNYDHNKIEKKWQKEWEYKKSFQAKNSKGKKFYSLIEFPYPSGAGLHVGHIRSNTAIDIISRKRRMEGYNVLYPIGWDAFGLPTENYAIKTGIAPAKVTKQNTDTFKRQLKSLGFSFDWSREVNTTDPKYYKWTQWIFLQMFKNGLAYKHKTEINWCPSCKIGLANEEVIDGKCERCGAETTKKEKEQWMLAITKYADRLDKDLDSVDYLEKIKISQRNWIGKSEGSEVEFKINNYELRIKIFTTRADTLFGATYVVLAPEHELVNMLIKNEKLIINNKEEVEEYIKKVKNKTDEDRVKDDKEKTGVEIKGIKAINPANGKEIPVWIADYVLASYGTGAVMAVPAHDERDFEFAKKYNLPMKRVVEPQVIYKDGDSGIKEGLPFIKRNLACVILRNPKNNKYLCTNWKDHNMHGLVTGGIEEDEDLVETAKREIYEETGYKNVKFIKDPDFAIHTFFYHRVKKINRHARFNYVFFDLIDEEKDKINEEESKVHELIWKTKDELKTFFTVAEGDFSLNLINNNNFIYTEDGILHDSDIFDDMNSEEARKEITKFVGGKIVTKYKLRDWVFSRQRYWGEPIPLVECLKCGWVPVPEKSLPVTLPKVKSYEPTDNGESPLANIKSWVNTTCPKCKGKAKRETDTMPNWAGSSWYYLRYTDPNNKKEIASKKNLKYWAPVDWYNGGMEHVTLHLLYSRFWHKFLYDIKLVPTKEPYKKRTAHGMILAPDGEKMSKSRGNVVNPDEIIKLYGADTLRLYEMFIGPFDQTVVWNTNSIIGSRRFLEKVWRIGQKITANNYQNFYSSKPKGSRTDKDFDNYASLQTLLHKTIKKVSEDIESMNYNTAVSSMMVLVNEMDFAFTQGHGVTKKDYKLFLQILAPFAPHITEELWNQLGERKSIVKSLWPKWDKEKIIEDKIKIMIQINGRVRSEINIPTNTPEGKIKEMAQTDSNVIPWILNKEIKRIIYVPGRVINIVV